MEPKEVLGSLPGGASQDPSQDSTQVIQKKNPEGDPLFECHKRTPFIQQPAVNSSSNQVGLSLVHFL